MTEAFNWRALLATASGLVAGVLFAVVQIVGAAEMGAPSTFPFRLFASVLLGVSAFDSNALSGAVVVATLLHLFLSAFYGMVYGALNARVPAGARVSWAREAGLGTAVGLVLWLVNFQIVARLFYPWFLSSPQLYQAAAHALAFGLPLGLLYASAERRMAARRRTPRQEILR